MNHSLKRTGSFSALGLLVFGALLTTARPAGAASQFTTLYSFSAPASGDNPDGASPFRGLIQGSDGNFYGTVQNGGTHGDGTIFKITPTGTFTTLYSFDYATGAHPNASLVQGSDGDFYGTTGGGGPTSLGTIFKITPTGTLTTIISFNGLNGASPLSGLLEGTDGNFYGATAYGGPSYAPGHSQADGTVYRLTPTGILTTLHSFGGSPNDGVYPYSDLIEGTDGNFYGTTSSGGASDYGTVFQVTPVGTETILHSFGGPPGDGAFPYDGLVEGSDGAFYGLTNEGGNAVGGTAFKVTSAGAFTTLVNFDITDGSYPYDHLVLGTDGDFYGTTSAGGSRNEGTTFRMTAGGALTTLHDFTNTLLQGIHTTASLVEGSDGDFYGMAEDGGAGGVGTIFKFTPGPVPPTITSFTPTRGPIGTVVTITGTNFNGATEVRFHNSDAATYSVNAAGTQATVTVPKSTEKGTITIATPGGSVKSVTPFTVTP